MLREILEAYRFKTLDVTALGIQLLPSACVGREENGGILCGIDFIQAWMLQQTETSNGKERVINIGCVLWAVG